MLLTMAGTMTTTWRTRLRAWVGLVVYRVAARAHEWGVKQIWRYGTTEQVNIVLEPLGLVAMRRTEATPAAVLPPNPYSN